MKMGKYCSLVDSLLGLRHSLYRCCQELFVFVLSFTSKVRNIDLVYKVLKSTSGSPDESCHRGNSDRCISALHGTTAVSHNGSSPLLWVDNSDLL